MPRKKRFTVEQHQQYGEIIKLMRDALMEIDIALSNTYGKTHEISKFSDKAFRNLELLKCRMDTLMMVENPPMPHEPRDLQDKLLNAYYGRREWGGLGGKELMDYTAKKLKQDQK